MAYSKIRETTIGGQAGTTWTIQIWRENYSGSSSSMDLQGEGFEITWTGEGQTRNNQFLTSECVLKFYVQNGGDESLQDLIFNSGEKEFFIRIYKNGTNISNLWWFGFIQPSFDRISNEPYPYIIDLIATDSIGVFSKRKNDLLTPSTWSAADKIINHIVDFGSTMGLNSISGADLAPVPLNHRYIKTNIDWFKSGDTYQDADPFYSYYTSPAAYRKDVDKRPLEYKKYNVLKGALKTFNARCYLSDGAYWFTQSTNNLGSSGDIRIYNYIGINNEVPPQGQFGNENTILHINQTTSANKGVVLGSGGKTFDPVLKSVSCDFVNGVANFILPGNTSLITPISTGYLQGDADQVGSLFISLKVYHKEVFNENQINFPSGSPTYDLVNGGFRSTINFTIKVGTGSDTRYLAVSGASMVWQTSVPTGNFKLEMTRGFGASGGTGTLLLNNTSAAYGWANTTSLSNSDFEIDEFPCKITKSGSIYTARTRVNFEGTIPPPPVSGEMTIQCVGANQYWIYASSATPPFKPDTGGVNFADQIPSTVTKETFVNPNLDSTLSANQDAISLGANEGVTFTTSQNSVDAFEDEDLGEINVGQTSETNPNFQSNINSVQHNTGTTNSPILVPSQNFRRSDTGSYINILNLVTSDYLSLQSKPLEILQADIFSPSISPSKLIKYDIDNPESGTSFSYYQFLGGTFKAQSETMSGEWFRVSLTSGGINDNNPFVGPHKFGNIDIALDNSELTHNNFTTKNKTNSYGIVSTQLVENTAIDRIVLSANTKGKVYDNQKLLLTFPDGEHELIVTANGTFATNTTTIILDSFTPNITYPVGSILSPLIFDLTNVITGGGGGSYPTLAQVTGDRMTVEGIAGTTGGTSVVDSGSVHTITEGAAWIHTQDIGDKSGNDSLNLRLYSGQGEGTNFDRSQSSIPNDSTARQTGNVAVESGDLKNTGSGNSTTGEIALSSGSSMITSGVAESGSVIISSGSATSAGNTTSGNITIETGASITSAGNTTSGNITITQGASMSGSTYMMPGSLTLGNILGQTKIKGTVTQIGESTPSTGKVLQWDGLKAVWAASVGGSSTQVQYNQGGVIKGEAGFVYDEGNDRLTVPKVNTPILQSIAGDGTVSHQIYTVSQNMAILSNTSVDVYLNAGNATAGSKAFQIKSAVTGNIVFAVTDTGVIKAIGNKIQDSAGTDRIDVSDNTKTKIDKNLQLLGSSPATIFSPDADKLILSSVDDLEFKIASGGASSKSFKFINNTTEVGSINSSGDLQIDGGLTTGGGTITIGGSNSNLELDAGSDIILEADQNGGGLDSTIQYPDSGGTNRIMLAVDNNVVILSNRAANGTVEIRANSSTAGGSGETTSAIFKDDAVVLIKEAEFSAGISDSGTIAAGTWNGTAIAQAKIADQAINEAKLQVSNAPVNGYVLTAQSGNTGGLTWAAQSGGGGGSNTHRSILNCGFNDTSTTKGLFPFGHGGLSDASASPSLQEFSCVVAAYDGYVDYVVLRCTGASGTTAITFHKRAAGTAGVPATGNYSVNVSVSANTAVKATFGATNGAFSAGDIIATGYDAGTTGLGDAVATMSIVYDLNNPL